MDASDYPDGSGAAAQRGQANLNDVDAPILHGAKASKSFMTAVQCTHSTVPDQVGGIL